MLERRGRPGNRVMALLAVVGEAQSRMVRSQRIIVRVTGVAIRSDGLEIPAGVTAHTVEARMSAGKREEVVLEVPAAPSRGSVASLAGCCPAVGNMVRGYGLSKVSLVTKLTLHRSTPELTYGRLEVAALTRSYCVRSDEVEASIGMLGDKAGRSPVQLFVTSLTIQPKSRSVRVRMTTAAAA